MFRRSAQLAAVFAAISTLAVHVTAAAPVAMPVPLHGVWFPTGATFKADCTAYLVARPKTRGGDFFEKLVGAVLITPNQIHDVAEYGEGNFYRPVEVKALGRAKWQVKTALTLDVGPSQDEPGVPATLTISLKGKTLEIGEINAVDQNIVRQTLKKCSAALPR